jgi:hypothetical protein
MPELPAFRVVAILCVRAPNGVIISTRDQVDTCNEEALAHDVAAKYLADFGSPQTVLIKLHEGPMIFRTP